MVDRAEGVWIYDVNGRRYLDATGGAVVVGIGHAVPEVLEAIRDQASKVAFAYYGQFSNQPQQELASELAAFCPGDLDHVFFTSGGSEAVESAIKLSRAYFRATGRDRKHKVIGRWRSYHGSTLGALSASGHVLRREPYQPHLLNFAHVAPPYCYRCFLHLRYPSCAVACAQELERTIIQENPDEVAAFIVEPVTGSSVPGLVPPPEYFRIVRDICDRYDVHLIVDEVLCGMGRTGRNFAIEHWDVVPDLLVTAKGLSSGYMPLGAVVATSRIYDGLMDAAGYFEHGYTYSGHPLSCAAGLAVLRYIRANGLVERAAELGPYLIERLRAQLADVAIVGEIDGLGLLVGIELVRDPKTREPFDAHERVAARVVARAFDKGVILLPGSGGQADGIHGDRLEIAPPLVIGYEEIDLAVDTLRDSLIEVSQELGAGEGPEATAGGTAAVGMARTAELGAARPTGLGGADLSGGLPPALHRR
jgi:adenosylmethionine-8-amino-7-oxononanoate aminotransferase